MKTSLASGCFDLQTSMKEETVTNTMVFSVLLYECHGTLKVTQTNKRKYGGSFIHTKIKGLNMCPKKQKIFPEISYISDT